MSWETDPPQPANAADVQAAPGDPAAGRLGLPAGAASAAVLSIGDELLIGDTVNTNAAVIGRLLREVGVRLARVVTVGDEAAVIRKALEAEIASVPLVITTGGLGPTHDDVTRKALFEWYGAPLVVDQKILRYIEAIFRDRGLPMTDSNRDLARIPEGAVVLFNRHGSAPGLWLEKDGCAAVMLPGVPHEMRHLMDEQVLPRLRAVMADRNRSSSLYLQTAGEAESVISEQFLGNLADEFESGMELAFLPRSGAVTLRIGLTSASAGQEGGESSRLETFREVILSKIGFCVYGEGREASLARSLGALLSARGWSMSAAESCTGGALMDAITDIPGSSAYLRGGVVAYSNDIKVEQLGVSPSTIERHGAVSRETVFEMADGAAARFRSDVAIAISGIAGPDGGTDEKPVGLVWIALRTPNERFALRLQLTRDRLINKERAVTIAMEALRRTLAGVDRMPYGLEKVSP